MAGSTERGRREKDRRESDQKIERKRGIEKQRTTPKSLFPKGPINPYMASGVPPSPLSVSLSFLLWLLIPSFLLCLPWTSCQIAGCGSESATSRLDTANRRGGNSRLRMGKRTSGVSLFTGVIPTEKQIEAMETILVVFIFASSTASCEGRGQQGWTEWLK